MPEGARRNAYANQPLSIGHGATISQPHIVALVIDRFNLRSVDRMHEVGAGCGYQTAVLAKLAAQVFMVELIPELQTEARDRLKALGYGNIGFRLGDCWRDRPKEAPFDAVIVTTAPAPALTAQLVPGGRLVAPVGRQHEPQFLNRILRREDGELE